MAGEWDANQAWHLTNISLRYACLESHCHERESAMVATLVPEESGVLRRG